MAGMRKSNGQPAPVSDEREPARAALLRRPFGTGFLVTLGGLAALALGMAITSLSLVLIYVAFALFIALGLEPVVGRLEQRGIARAWAIVIVCVAFVAAIGLVVVLVSPTVTDQVTGFVTSLPTLIDDFRRSEFAAFIERSFGDRVDDLLTELQRFLSDPANLAAIGGGLLQVGTTLATGVSGVIIVIVLSLYFIASLPSMKEGFVRVAPARSRIRVRDLTDQITASVGGYLAGMVILAAINAVVVFVIQLLLGLPFPQLMAVIAFCLTLIPLIGSVLFWIVASGLALLDGFTPALVFAVVYLVYIQIEAYLLTPRVMNRTIAVPGALVVIGALVGGTLLGLLGALVAIPVTASLLLIVRQVFIPAQDAKT